MIVNVNMILIIIIYCQTRTAVQISAHANVYIRQITHAYTERVDRKKIRMIKIKITRKYKVIVSKIYQFIKQTDRSLLNIKSL